MDRRAYHPATRSAAALLTLSLALLLGGCAASGGALERIPTSAAPVGGRTPEPTPTVAPTIAPSGPRATLAAAGGTAVACEANTLRIPLEIDGGPVGAAGRIAADADTVYVVADGALYTIDPGALSEGEAPLEGLLEPGDRVGERVVQEIADVALSPDDNLLFALDKAGHVYRVDLESGRATLTYRAAPDPEEDFTSQLVALTVNERGRPVVLDTAYGALWEPTGQRELTPIGETLTFTDGNDVAYAAGSAYVLRRDGTISTVSGTAAARTWGAGPASGTGFSLFRSDYLGVSGLYVVDAVGREVIGYDLQGAALSRHAFVFGDMGLLRDATFAGDRLYAVADGDLYVYPGPDGTTGACPPPTGIDAQPRPLLYGVDVLAAMRGWRFPIEGGTLPDWPRVYPGASRIYRMGVHRGMDIYYWDGPEGFTTGWPVLAVAPGEVVSATVPYTPLTAAEYDDLIDEALAAGATPEDVLTRLSGKQVVIEHAEGLRSVYSHLDEIADGVRAGEAVRLSQQIGTVGATGTEGEGRPGEAAPHLHVEFWIGDRYLGQGITLPETLWWFQQIFGG